MGSPVRMAWQYKVLAVVNTFILGPISAGLLWKYKKHVDGDEHIYTARRPGLVLLQSIIAVLFMSFYLPLHIIVFELLWDNNGTVHEWWEIGAFFSMQSIVFISTCLRCYHSFYDFQIMHSISQKEWKSILSAQRRGEDFVFKYKDCLDSPKKMFLFVLIIPDFVFSAIFFLLIGMGSIVGINEDTASYTLGAPFLIYTFFQFTLLTIMIVSVVNTWREVHDHIFVRGELILQAVLLSITVTAQFVIFLADAISTDNEEYDELFYFCYFVMATMLCFCSVLVSTKYLVFRQWQSTRNEEHVPDANTDAVVRTTETDFKAFISTKRGFEAMLSHLALESRDHVNNLCLVEIALVLDHSLNLLEYGTEYVQWANMLRAKLLVPPPLDGAESTIYSGNPSTTGMLLALHDKYFDKKAVWIVKMEDESSIMDDQHYREVYNRGTMRKSRRLSQKTLNLQEIPSVFNEESQSVEYVAAAVDSPKQLSVAKSDAAQIHNIKDIVEVLYNVSNTISKRLQQEYSKMAEAKAADRVVAGLSPDVFDKMVSHQENRDQVIELETQRSIEYAGYEWNCDHCYCKNKAMHYGNQLRKPPKDCYLCGERMGSSLSPELAHRLSVASRNDFVKETKLGTEYMQMVQKWKDDKEGNKCGDTYIDRCPDVQLLGFIMKCYNYNSGRKCKCDEDDGVQPPEVDSMHELIETLPGLGLQRVIQCYEHVVNEHKDDDTLYDYFAEEVGTCHDKKCEFIMRNLGRRAICVQSSLNSTGTSASSFGTERKFNDSAEDIQPELPRQNTAVQQKASSFEFSITCDVSQVHEYSQKGSTPRVTVTGATSPLTMNLKAPAPGPENQSANKPPIKSSTTKTLDTLPIAKMLKADTQSYLPGISVLSEYIADDQERIVHLFLQKWHSFLFHPHFRKTAKALMKEKGDFVDEAADLNINLKLNIGNSNKFISHNDGNKPSGRARLNKNRTSKFINPDGESIMEYQFGSQIRYHVLMPNPNHGNFMEEMTKNAYRISMKSWNDTLERAKLIWKSETVQERPEYKAKFSDRKYGIQTGDIMGVENIVAIMLYCNYTDLQNKFSKTFRKIEDDDTDEDIAERHRRDFYWFGRSLFIAVHFHGQQMEQNEVVWHGLSKKMVFEIFASFYFDSPTSTTVAKMVAQAFTQQGEGIILKLKSKYKTSCATMLDVSRFSDYPDEQERLFLNETLVIADVLKVSDGGECVWKSYGKHLKAILFFEKITTGNAADDTWNIEETAEVKNQLVHLIDDHFSMEVSPDLEEYPKGTPRYILDLFRTYLHKQQMPRFDHIDVIWGDLPNELQGYFGDTNRQTNELAELSREQVIVLFPNALNYTDEKGYIKFVQRKRAECDTVQ